MKLLHISRVTTMTISIYIYIGIYKVLLENNWNKFQIIGAKLKSYRFEQIYTLEVFKSTLYDFYIPHKN